MIIHELTINNFKSIYDVRSFNFDDLRGLIKLSGPIGSGKTTLCEAILYGLYGKVKEQKIPSLVAWNTKRMEVTVSLTSNNYNIYIKRCNIEPLEVYINGKPLPASSKRDIQEILEEEYYDVPRMAVEKMCLISFNSFKTSLANMNPSETKSFLDNIFGFSTFTEYNDIASGYKSQSSNEVTRLETEIEVQTNQLEMLKQKQMEQTNEINYEIDFDAIDKEQTQLKTEKDKLIQEGIDVKKEADDVINIYIKAKTELERTKTDIVHKQIELTTLAEQVKKQMQLFKNGHCPTCGQAIPEDKVKQFDSELCSYRDKWSELNDQLKGIESEIQDKQTLINELKHERDSKLSIIKEDINKKNNRFRELDMEVRIYNEKVKAITNNFDELIEQQQSRIETLSKNLIKAKHGLESWTEMSNLLTKTLRYKLLDSLIPHIHNSIQKFINKLDQQFSVRYDQEFKAHIYVDNYNKEIPYNSLSTGQKKSLDLSIVFGILQNIITNIEFNVIILDELFSNMDADTRNLMLELLNSSIMNGPSQTRSVFVINHAEMPDDYFKHKIKVSLKTLSIPGKKPGQLIPIYSSIYKQIF